jgi:hypothetical protein
MAQRSVVFKAGLQSAGDEVAATSAPLMAVVPFVDHGLRERLRLLTVAAHNFFEQFYAPAFHKMNNAQIENLKQRGTMPKRLQRHFLRALRLLFARL